MPGGYDSYASNGGGRAAPTGRAPQAGLGIRGWTAILRTVRTPRPRATGRRDGAAGLLIFQGVWTTRPARADAR